MPFLSGMNTPLLADFPATLAAAREGDATALDDLFRAFYPKVEEMVHRGLAHDLRRSRPWLTARFSTGDVVQDVFRQLLKDLSGFEGKTEGAFCGYLSVVIRNRLVDTIRFHEAAQRDGRVTGGMPDTADPQSGAQGPLTQVGSRDEVQAFQEALAGFSEKEQLLLRGRLEQELAFHDLAERLGYPSKWAARRAFYAAQASLIIRLRKASEES